MTIIRGALSPTALNDKSILLDTNKVGSKLKLANADFSYISLLKSRLTIR